MIGLWRPSALYPGAHPSLPAVGATRAQGSTASIEVRSAVGSGPAGEQTAQLVLARCASDLPLICDLFDVGYPLRPQLQVVLVTMPVGMPAAHDGDTIYCDIAPGAATSAHDALYTCHLLATQLVQIVAERAGTAWSPLTAHGQALSRTLAGSLYPRWSGPWSSDRAWLRGDRADTVTTVGDPDDLAAIGCASLFLDYLHHELDLDWRTIIRAAGPSLAVTYCRATGAIDDPFPSFVSAIANADPTGFGPLFPLTGESSRPPARLPANASLAGAGPAAAIDRRPPTAPMDDSPVTDIAPAAGIRLADVLAHRRWWVIDTPLRHLRVDDVFTDDVYGRIVDTFRTRMASGDFTRSLAGYDASAAAVTPANAGGFEVFLTREWHELIAALLDVPVTGDIIATLHHHAAGSLAGSVHNDLNPGWFPRRNDSGINVHDPRLCNYRTGISSAGVAAVERTRAISLLYYLDTPPDISGGGTGFYRSAGQSVDQPDVVVPPRNNSLVAFECTPFSFHTFISNIDRERNCLVMWWHRDRGDAIARWGNGSIVKWQ